MWRFVEQLIGRIRGQSVSGVAPLRTARLAIETLENRTVLSANFGVDLETLAYHQFTESPAPRILFNYESIAALAVGIGQEAPPTFFAEDRRSDATTGDTTYLFYLEVHGGFRPPDFGRGDGKSPLQGMQNFDQAYDFSGLPSPEDRLSGTTAPSSKGPLRGQSQTPASGDAGLDDYLPNFLGDSFDPPQFLKITTTLERIAEARQAATSPLLPPMNVTTAVDETETADSATLLANYATLASLIDEDSSATSHDAAFDGYETTRGDDAGSEEYLRLLAEDQTNDAAADAGGFVELAETTVAGVEGLSNLAADTQQEAVESALRSLAARRGDARTSLLPENWLEQAWHSADVAQQGEANANQIADEPGGMILLQPMADGAGDELIAAGDMSEVIKTAVEMEATIGAFQAFDVSIDEASAAVVKPAPAHELGAKQDRDESSNEDVVDRQAASGLGVLAVGAMALAAKRQMDDRRRKPK
jgi:hypothetical protein